MLYSGRTFHSASFAGVSIKALAAVAILGLGTLLQACSSSREQSDGSAWKLWGNDKPQESAAAKPPSSFDRDGPPSRSAEPAYRGGRDPVTGRANDWPPAAPPPVESAALAPLPQYNSPPPVAHPQAAYPQSAYAQPPASPYTNAPASTRPASPMPQAGAAGSVEVRPGDTLYRIAKAYNVTVPALIQANGLANESIRPGLRLTIPGR